MENLLKELEELNKKHSEERDNIVKKYMITLELRKLGVTIDNVKFLDTFITLDNKYNKSELRELLDKLIPITRPLYLKGVRLSNGYKNSKTDGYTPVNTVRVVTGNANTNELKVVVTIEILDKCYDLWIKLDSKDFNTKTSVYIDNSNEYGCDTVYKNSRLVHKFDEVYSSNIQTYGTHAQNLHRYTIWFSDVDESIDAIVDSM